MPYPHYAWNGVTIDDPSDNLDVKIGANPFRTLTIVSGTYRPSGDGAATDSIQALEDALNLHPDKGGDSFTCTLGSDGKCTVSFSGASTVILGWNQAGTNCDSEIWGWASGADESFVDSATSDYVCAAGWWPNTRPQNHDGIERSTHQGETFRTAGAVTWVTNFGGLIRLRQSFERVVPARIWQDCTDQSSYATLADLTAGDPNAAIERLWDWLITGSQVYYYRADGTEMGPYYLDSKDIDLQQYLTSAPRTRGLVDVNIPLFRS